MGSSLRWRRDGNLPEEITSFVGRRTLVARLTAELRTSRMVTAVGSGGVGKTRVALECARRLSDEFANGVWLAQLGALNDPDVLGSAIKNACGLADVSARADIQVVAEFLADKQLLLLLDTCEHMIDAVRELATTLLEAAPGLTILATSRQPLQLPEEHLVVIPPMDTTPEGEAVHLFASRARDAVPLFELGPHNIASVVQLCRRLDGIPLAVELAAVRMRGLSVEMILELVTRTTDILDRQSEPNGVDNLTAWLQPRPSISVADIERGRQSSEDGTGATRHQTLRAAIGWSHELCEPAERLLWARLSVFAGDFDADAARAVCSSSELPPDEISDLLGGLVHKSILTMQPNAVTIRYRMLDTLREYGAKGLEQLGGTEALQIRHRDYYLSLAQRGQAAWWGPSQVRWWQRMHIENANIRAAIDYSLTHRDQAALGLDLVASLWFLWVACGFSSEGRHYLVRALHANPRPSPSRCKALWVEAYLANAQGDIEAAVAAAQQCRREASEIGDVDAVIIATKMLGTSAFLTGKGEDANLLLGLAIKYLRDDPSSLNPGLMPAIVELALVYVMEGKPEQALPLLQECLDVCTQHGEAWLRSYAEYVQAMAYRLLGRTDEAIASIRTSLRIKRHFHDVLGIVLSLEALSQMVLEAGWAPAQAAHLQGAAEVNWRSYGLPLMGSPFYAGDHERCATEIRQRIGAQAYEAARAQGATMDLLTAVAYAIGESIDGGLVPEILPAGTGTF